MSTNLSVWVVVVCYHPELENLRRLCRGIFLPGREIVLVDNTEQGDLAAFAREWNAVLLPLGRNVGLAQAMNIGLRHALAGGADAILYFDQDSEIAPTATNELLGVLRVGSPGIASPVYVDRDSGRECPSQRFQFGILRNQYARGRRTPYEASVVISSGMAATSDTFRVAGFMDETLFIDHVDTEWCLRCRSRQVPIRVVPGAVMRHSVGSGTETIGPVRAAVHSPLRCYYQVRNSFLLLRYPYVPLPAGLVELVRVLANRMILVLFVGRKREYLWALWRGAVDGIFGVGGPFREKPSVSSKI